jgi:putative ABC transport system permease protein
MFFRLLLESFLRQRRRKALAGIAILLGTTAVTAMLALATTIGDRIHAELAVYGANIVVTPQAANLDVKIGDSDIHPTTGNANLRESDLGKLRTIFWANNITGVSPELRTQITSSDTSGKPVDALGLWFNHDLSGLQTGAPQLHPSWKLDGAWPKSLDQIVVGDNLAKRLNLDLGKTFSLPEPAWEMEAAHRSIPLAIPLTVTGILSSGDGTDDQILLPLKTAQRFNNTPDVVSRVEISARTKPEDAFARKDPDTLSPAQHEIWYCRPYANSIAYQIREAIP